jgi:hypothetical protein|tara:strand:+ start:314 stop:472 length:159 start_codon:yes stop_codon:yes gene_type:complete
MFRVYFWDYAKGIQDSGRECFDYVVQTLGPEVKRRIGREDGGSGLSKCRQVT